MSQSRQLAAIMFTDIVGYTQLMGKDSEKALELVRFSKEIQKPLVKKHNGQWLKEIGDGALVKFGTAFDAVNCAVEIQKIARAEFDGKLRIGVHSGDITIENNDVYGDGVNVASRLQTIADPGGIYLSESIEKAIRGQMKLELKYLGEKKLKNVDYGVRTYAIQGVGLPKPGTDQGYKDGYRYLAIARTYKWIALLSIVLLVGWILYFFVIDASETAAEREAIHVQILLPEDVYLATGTGHPVLDISPDGSTVVFVGTKSGQQDIYLKLLNDTAIRVLEGTEDGEYPFFSLDGLWIGFFRGNTLMKIPTVGGVPVAVHDINGTSVNRGITWYQMDSVVYTGSSDGGLFISSIEGNNKGKLSDWRTLLDNEPYYWPSAINDLNGVLFTDFRSNKAEEQNIGLYLLDKQEMLHLINGGTFPKYSGKTIFFTRNNALFKAAFDLNDRLVGDIKQLVGDIHTNINGSSLYAVGGKNLVYIEESNEVGQDQLVWVDRAGNTDLIYSNGKDFDFPKISPSGDRIVLTIMDDPNLDLWMLELERNSLTRLTSHPGEDFGAIWHPKDQLIAFSSEIAQDHGEFGPGIALLDVDTNKPPERYLPSPGPGFWEFPTSWSPDGKQLMFVASKGDDIRGLDILDVDRKERTTWLESSQREIGAAFSPNGKWVAYVSDMSGRLEVYLKPFDGDGAAIQVSTSGGTEPVWSPDGMEIFYRILDKMISVKIINDAPLQLAKPVMLFEKAFKRVRYGAGQANYDISSDGSRFLMIQNTSESQPRVINVILNCDKL